LVPKILRRCIAGDDAASLSLDLFAGVWHQRQVADATQYLTSQRGRIPEDLRDSVACTGSCAPVFEHKPELTASSWSVANRDRSPTDQCVKVRQREAVTVMAHVRDVEANPTHLGADRLLARLLSTP
jgi:hypothetical protein